MGLQVLRVTPRSLEATLARSPFVLLRLDLRVAGFPKGLVEYLDERFPEAFTFGTMSRADFTPSQLSASLQSALGPLRRGIVDGYYLLEAGYVVGQHLAQLRPPTVQIALLPEEEALRARLRASPSACLLKGNEFEQVAQLVAYFEPIVERKRRAAGHPDEGWTSSGPSSSSWQEDPPPPAPAPAPAGNDPYVVLGIGSGATDEEIRAAYKHQLKLNHPDKVAHLSPALQQFAQQQTLLVMAAYEALRRRRRMGDG